MVESAFQAAVLLEPVGGTAVELGDEGRLAQLQLRPEDLAKEAVVAISLAMVVERDDELA